MNSTAKNTVTAEEIDALMKDAEISISTTHEKCTVVSVKLKNGFVLTESSACVDKANYDVEMGTKICLQRIKDKLWAFEGYVLQKALYAAKQAAEDAKKTTAKERVQKELSELEERFEKIRRVPCGMVAFNEAESHLLHEQYEVMEEYIRILRARLSIWRDEL
jgi:hypothetical protein